MIQVFGTEWFKKYNKILVKIAKLPFIGEWVFCFKKYGHYFDINNLLEVQPNAVVEDMKLRWTKCVKVKGQWVAYDCTSALHNKLIKKECKEKLLPTRRNHYFVRNEYALRLQSVFYPIWITFHIWDIITRPIPQLNLGFDTLTVYPDKGDPGTTSCCGYAAGISTSLSFADARSQNGNDHGQENANIETSIYNSSTNFRGFYRGIILYDTSSLGANATISDAVCSFYGNGKSNAAGTFNLYVCSSNPASNTSIVNADFNIANFGSTSFGSVAYADFDANNNTYTDITLTTAGKNAISKTGITKFGTMIAPDFSNSEPSKVASASSYYLFNGTVGATTAKYPKLVVTYTPAPVAPTVTTQAPSSLTSTTLTGNGNITATGGANATRRGFCYKVGTSGDPTTADSVAYDDGDYGIGAYTKGLTGLTASTGYRVRAYAVNSAGTSYGSTVQVTTDQSGRFFLFFQ
jgi:hypothetical protein